MHDEIAPALEPAYPVQDMLYTPRILHAFCAALTCLVVLVACDRNALSQSRTGQVFRPVGDLMLLRHLKPITTRETSATNVMKVPDSKIEYDVRTRLMVLPIDEGRVDVRVENQIVVLSGQVASGSIADEAETASRLVPGVRDVLNRIEY